MSTLSHTTHHQEALGNTLAATQLQLQAGTNLVVAGLNATAQQQLFFQAGQEVQVLPGTSFQAEHIVQREQRRGLGFRVNNPLANTLQTAYHQFHAAGRLQDACARQSRDLFFRVEYPPAGAELD